MPDESPLLQSLSPEQREAVLAAAGPVLLLAGAGSGKTRVITHRIAYLVLERSVPSESILAVTFTNKAAAEMKARVAEMLVGHGFKGRVSTFHSFCVWLLRRESAAAGLDPSFVIFDEADQLSAVRSALSKLDLSESRVSPRAALSRISAHKTGGADEDADAGTPWSSARLLEAYQAELDAARALDFDDLLLRAVALLRGEDAVRDRYRRAFRYVLVDEYQDTNHAQFDLIALLAAPEGNVTVVGDEDQSIYSWRGADIRNILEFERVFPAARVLRLQDNYRSSGAILSSASALVAHNRARKGKILLPKRGQGESVVARCAGDEYQEASWVVDRIRTAPNGSRAAILFRVNAQSRVFEEALRRAQLSYAVVGTLAFYDRKEIKDLLAYLRLLANPHDSVALKRILNVPARGLGQRTLDHIEQVGRSQGLSAWDALERASSDATLGARAAQSLRTFRATIEGLRSTAHQSSVRALVERVVAATGYGAMLAQERDAQERLANVDELVSAASEYDAAPEDPALPGFLDRLALLSPVDVSKGAPPPVTLMTLHAAKGLEFDSVFVVGMEEGLLPHARSLTSPSMLEEERRLCYVGMTRARDSLALTWAQSRRFQERRRLSEPSRFLAEAGVEATTSLAGPPLPAPVRRWSPTPAPAVPETLRPGVRVQHRTFGVGTVVRADGSGDDMRLTVSFAAAGVKRLVARFAELEPL